MENDNHWMTRREGGAAEEAQKEAQRKDAGGDPTREALSAPSAAEGPPDPAAAYQKLVAEKQELFERLQRKQAELENFRKRLQREKEDFLQHATADLVRALLPALDAFDRALKHRDANIPEDFYQGMDLIYRQLLEVLGRAGLSPVETAGKLFDPHFHQAVETVQVPGARDQEIVEELQRGYRLKHRLLRPAIVKVATSGRGGEVKPQSAPSDPPDRQK